MSFIIIVSNKENNIAFTQQEEDYLRKVVIYAGSSQAIYDFNSSYNTAITNTGSTNIINVNQGNIGGVVAL